MISTFRIKCVNLPKPLTKSSRVRAIHIFAIRNKYSSPVTAILLSNVFPIPHINILPIKNLKQPHKCNTLVRIGRNAKFKQLQNCQKHICIYTRISHVNVHIFDVWEGPFDSKSQVVQKIWTFNEWLTVWILYLSKTQINFNNFTLVFIFCCPLSFSTNQ